MSIKERLDGLLTAFDGLAKKAAPQVREVAPSPSQPPPATPASAPARPPSPTTTATPPPPPPQHDVAAADDQSDAAQLEDVVMLLRECVAQAEADNDELRKQARALEADVAFWKAESYATLPSTVHAVANSAEYQTVQRDLKDERSRHKALQARAAELERQLASEQASVAAQKATMDAALGDRDAQWQAQLRQAEERVAQVERQLESERRLRSDDAERAAAAQDAALRTLREAHDAAFKVVSDELRAREAQWAREAAQLRVELDGKAELLRLRSDSDAAGEDQLLSHSGGGGNGVGSDRAMQEELRCLQRDREMLADEVRKLQDQVSLLLRRPQAEAAAAVQVATAAPAAPAVVVDHQDVADFGDEPATGAADLIVQQRFGLPRTQRQLALHGCSHGPQHGYLYLTQRFLCFGTSAVGGFLSRKDMVLLLDNIRSLDKTGNTTVRVTLRDGTALDFKGLRQRKQLVGQIYEAARKHGVLLELLRDGAADPDTGVLREEDFVMI